MKNIMIIGAGPHARRIYIPIINECKNVQIVCLIDVESQKDIISKYINENNYKCINKCIFLKSEEIKIKNNKLTKKVECILNNELNNQKIDAIFVCTEPSAHVAYAIWALKNKISILMDKPISAPLYLSTRMNKVKQISKDYEVLRKIYKKAKKDNDKLRFEVMAQRRYHFAFLKIKSLVDEVKQKTGVPITSFQSTHCDGQWRMPKEIIEQDYHPYNQGYGKCLHSGYHSIDIMDWLVRNSISSNEQKIDSIEVTSNFIYPDDLLVQLPLERYKELFGSEQAYIGYSPLEYKRLFKKHGEVDAQIQVAYKNKKNNVVAIGQYNLLHNSFSQRNWDNAQGKDLYKGNGRIRHELHYIVQGPFQTIVYESFQSEEILNKKTNHSNVGGEYHLDIHVFRNSKMFKEWESYKKYSFDDFDVKFLKGYSRGHQEDARRECIIKFLKSLDDSSVVNNSDIMDHYNSIKIIESAYKSMLKKKKKKDVLIKVKRKNNE